MLQVSLDCPFLIAPSIFSNVYYIGKVAIETISLEAVVIGMINQ